MNDFDINYLINRAVEKNNYEYIIQILRSNRNINNETLGRLFNAAIAEKRFIILIALQSFKKIFIYTNIIYNYSPSEIILLTKSSKGIVTEHFNFMLFEYLLDKRANEKTLNEFIQCQELWFVGSYLRKMFFNIDLYQSLVDNVNPLRIISYEEEIIEKFYGYLSRTEWSDKCAVLFHKLLNIFGISFLQNLVMKIKDDVLLTNISRIAGPLILKYI